jgi:hypothetical protein
MLDGEELLTYAQELLERPDSVHYYKHDRNETTKIRRLFSLKTSGRIFTSCALKQLIYFFDLQPSESALGYRVNKGFAGGHIFQPWLYLWIKFISNISSALEDPDNENYYVVKTDVKNFYDKIPHDNLKRMLLGGVNPKIDRRREQLTEETDEQYKALISAIFVITEQLVKSNVGLPQGPAYARFLAELYLDNIDTTFDKMINAGDLCLYQRYVDDIFFVAQTHGEAQRILGELTHNLELLGLEINPDKTIITQIKNFSDDFNRYRSQSKYAIDRTSKNFSDATEAQQNLALTEFMSLVQSDSCEDDLAFIFSHLNGVPQADNLKVEKVIPTIKSGIGRGSVYKHLFGFVLDNPANAHLLDAIDQYTDLQSEVLTSAFISSLENNKSRVDELNSLFDRIKNKLTKTELVEENLCYLAVTFGTDVEFGKISPEVILNVLASNPYPENTVLPSGTLSLLNTALNNIKSLNHFTRAMYPICASESVDKDGLNSLAATFYAKLASDEANGKLTVEKASEINTAASGLKFYYLVCLFSISDRNSSTDLLQSIWKYCTHVHNVYDIDSATKKIPNWFKKIQKIDINDAKCQLIISSIVDGNIFRGLDDTKNIFERFHTLLLIFLSFKVVDIKNINLVDALTSLKDKAVFYKWLLDRNNVSFFPNSKTWFEKNVIDNGVIVLRRHGEVLFRRPTEDFYMRDSVMNEHNGYSEIVEVYDATRHQSLARALTALNVKQKFDKLTSIIETCVNGMNLPNFFCDERIVTENNLRPFSDEFMKSDYLIFDDGTGTAYSYSNNKNNFISCFLRIASAGKDGDLVRTIHEKYINNLEGETDLYLFIKLLHTQLVEAGDTDNPFQFDLAVSAALYLSLDNLDPIRRIEKFTSQYHKFNPNPLDRHIYGVNAKTLLDDSSPLPLIRTVESSLRLITDQVLPSLAFFLAKDIAQYGKTLEKIVDAESTGGSPLRLIDFQRVDLRVSVVNESVRIDKLNFPFSKVKLLNPVSSDIQPLEAGNAVRLNSSEHVYAFQGDGVAYVIALQSSISKIYESIVRRSEGFTENGIIKNSFPNTVFKKEAILSLGRFDKAVQVISVHRNITANDAEDILINWLKFLPLRYHQPLTTLISAHRIMTAEDISEFIDIAKNLISNKDRNAFLIKDVSDYNGTHRILYKGTGIGRNVGDLSPTKIALGATTATIIVDNIITGSQIVAALRYYATGEGFKESARYYKLTDLEHDSLKKRLKAFESLEICTVLFTKKAIQFIEEQCREIFNEKITVNIINGRDIGDDAMFATTQQIGEAEKAEIRSLLCNREQVQGLYSHLATSGDGKNFSSFSEDELDKTNLIARFQSLPKKCFKFLHCGLRYQPDCHPMVRVLETTER